MYLDPGFGGMLVQVIVAVVAAGGAILFALRKKIKKLFNRSKSGGVDKDTSHDDPSGVEDIIDTLDDESGDEPKKK